MTSQRPRHQGQQPGLEAEMISPPEYIRANYRDSGKRDGKVALITGCGRTVYPQRVRGAEYLILSD